MSQTEIRNEQNTTPFTGPNLLGPEYKNDESPLATPLSHMNNGQEVPEEFKNARPSKRGILARIGAFLFGAGAAGGAAFGFGAGGVIGGLIGVGATAAVGIATGGAAIIGGALALGIFAGVKALVNHFRRAPDPEPRITNNTLPENNPEDDSYNETVADAIKSGSVLTGSLQSAVDTVAARYAKEAGLPVKDLIGEKRLDTFAKDVKDVKGNVDAAKLGKLLEKYMNGNVELHDNMRKLNLPQEHMTAINEFLDELKRNYGDCAPADKQALRTISPTDLRLDAFVVALEKKVDASDVKVTPEMLKQMAKEAIAPEMAVRALGAVIKEEAAKLGVTMSSEAIRMAAVEMYLSANRPEINSLADARAFVSEHKQLMNTVRQKGMLMHAMGARVADVNLMPNEHKFAFQNAVSDMRKLYGENSLPANMNDILNVKIAIDSKEELPIHSHLMGIAENGRVSLTDFTKAARAVLKAAAQQNAMMHAIEREMESTYKIKPTTEGCHAIFKALEDSVNGFTGKVGGMKNATGASAILGTREVYGKLAEIAANMNAAERDYLGQVSEDARPMLQSIIRSLPFDARNNAKSIALVRRNAGEMKEWKKSIAYGDKNMSTYCNKLCNDLNLFANEKKLDSKVTNDVFGAFISDANRSDWSVNGKEMKSPSADTLVGDVRRLLPNGNDLAFMTRLCNQYLGTRVNYSLNGKWDVSGDSSAEHTAGTGLTTFLEAGGEGTRNGLVIQDKDKKTQYNISISEDQKSAVIEVLQPVKIIVDDESRFVVGTGMHRVRLNCQLSAGSEDGAPKVLTAEVGQEFHAVGA